MVALLAALSLNALAPQPARAVTYLEQIERLLLINAFLLDYRPGEAPLLPANPITEFNFDFTPQPDVDTRVGAKDEPVDPPGLIIRMRLRHISPSGWMLGVTASPPIEIGGFSAVWLGGEGGLRAKLGKLHGELRGFAIQGEVEGPITATDAADTFGFRNVGGDLRVGLPLGYWALYTGFGGGQTHTELDIGSDGVHVEFDNTYTYWLAGVGVETESWVVTFEQQGTEDFLRHYILAVGYRF